MVARDCAQIACSVRVEGALVGWRYVHTGDVAETERPLLRVAPPAAATAVSSSNERDAPPLGGPES